MNTVQLIGRLTRDPEVRYSQGSNPLAVARRAVAPRLLTNSGVAAIRLHFGGKPRGEKGQ